MKKTLSLLAALVVASTVNVSAVDFFKSGKKKQPKPETEKIAEEIVETVPMIIPADQLARLSGQWTIYNIHGEKVTGEERPYIDIETSTSRFYGSNGCNVINGNVAVTERGDISFTNIIATQRLCGDSPFEYLINTTLDDVVSFTIQQYGHEYYLDLKNKRGQVIMVLRKHNMDFLNGAWSVARIDGEPNRNQNMQLVIDIPETHLHGNTGCNILNGSLYIDPDKTNSIQFQEIITTRMACADSSTETALLIALEEVETAFASGNENVTLYDGRGREVLHLRRLDPATLRAD